MQVNARTRVATRLMLSIVAVLAVASSVAEAQQPLRWKFEKGEKLDYNMVQDMAMAAQGGPAGQMQTSMRQEMRMTWDVQEVQEDGDAVIRQTFDRVQMKMTTPAGGFEFDSESDEAPAGLAAMIAPLYQAMTKGEFIITMTPRGEVTDVQIPEEVVAALKNSPGAASMGDLATSEGFKKMISQGALVLPEQAPEKGDTWSTELEMKNPVGGTQTVETTYRYEGNREIDGTTYAVIRPELKMDFEEAAEEAEPLQPEAGQPQRPDMKMEVQEQSSEGEVLFNLDEGRLHTSTLKQDVTLEITIGGQTMQQKIDQQIDVKVSPAGESASTEPAAESQP